MMPASIQVCPVEIPGRGRAEGQPAIPDCAQLAAALARSLPLQVTRHTASFYLLHQAAKCYCGISYRGLFAASFFTLSLHAPDDA